MNYTYSTCLFSVTILFISNNTSNVVAIPFLLECQVRLILDSCFLLQYRRVSNMYKYYIINMYLIFLSHYFFFAIVKHMLISVYHYLL